MDLDRIWEEVDQHVVEGVGKRGGEGVEGMLLREKRIEWALSGFLGDDGG